MGVGSPEADPQDIRNAWESYVLKGSRGAWRGAHGTARRTDGTESVALDRIVFFGFFAKAINYNCCG